MINSRKIKGRMAELEITQKRLAEIMGMSQATVSQKINNYRPMDLDEAEIMCRALQIEQKEFSEYFFYKGSCIVQRMSKKV